MCQAQWIIEGAGPHCNSSSSQTETKTLYFSRSKQIEWKTKKWWPLLTHSKTRSTCWSGEAKPPSSVYELVTVDSKTSKETGCCWLSPLRMWFGGRGGPPITFYKLVHTTRQLVKPFCLPTPLQDLGADRCTLTEKNTNLGTVASSLGWPMYPQLTETNVGNIASSLSWPTDCHWPTSIRAPLQALWSDLCTLTDLHQFGHHYKLCGLTDALSLTADFLATGLRI